MVFHVFCIHVVVVAVDAIVIVVQLYLAAVPKLCISTVLCALCHVSDATDLTNRHHTVSAIHNRQQSLRSLEYSNITQICAMHMQIERPRTLHGTSISTSRNRYHSENISCIAMYMRVAVHLCAICQCIWIEKLMQFFVFSRKAQSNQFAVRFCGEHTSHFPQLITKKKYYSIRFFHRFIKLIETSTTRLKGTLNGDERLNASKKNYLN